MELRDAARRVREEHEAKTAQHRVEAAIVEAKRLAVFYHDGRIRRAGQALARPIDHGRGDVGGRDMAAQTHYGKSGLGRDPGTSCDVKYPLTQCKAGRSHQERNEVGRDVGDGSVIRACRLVLIFQFTHAPALMLASIGDRHIEPLRVSVSERVAMAPTTSAAPAPSSIRFLLSAPNA